MVLDLRLGNVHFVCYPVFVKYVFGNRCCFIWSQINEGGRESERKKIKVNVTFIIIRVELKESIS